MKLTRVSQPHNKIKPHYDVVVVGSGYGAGVAASRLARCGLNVCLLERGREFLPGEFPDRLGEGLANVQMSSSKRHIGSRAALYDLRRGKDMHVLVGCGLGGTSLINANVALEVEAAVFEDPAWPSELEKGQDLENGYERAREMLGSTPTPKQTAMQLPKFRALQKAAKYMGSEATRPPINVNFSDKVNKAGIFQPGCTLCGDCCSGCNVGAKNTTQMNYIADAARHGANIFTRATVNYIEQTGEGWRVFHEPTSEDDDRFNAPDRTITADMIFLGAGALGSTEILLRSQAKGLKLSQQLGRKFTGNGDILAFAFNNDEPINGVGVGEPPKVNVNDPVGPCIVGAIDLRKGDLSKSMIIEEGSIPGVLSPVLPSGFAGGNLLGQDTDNGFSDEMNEAGRVIKSLLGGSYTGAVHNTQTFLVMSHDDGEGKIELAGDTALVDWPNVARQPIFDHVDMTLEEATKATGGTYIKNPISRRWLGENLITVHPLGGCPMGANVDVGVVNHQCEVFNPSGPDETAVYDSLFVCDGSVMPRPLGVNPLLTITAIAERAVARLAKRKGWNLDYDKIGANLPDQPFADKAGVQFTERMTGYWSSLALEDHESAAQHGKNNDTPLSFTLNVKILDMDKFIDDPDRMGVISGTVECPALSRDPLDVSEGEFNLFRPDPDIVDQSRMEYRMTLIDRNGKSYKFDGHKKVKDNFGFDMWGDTTRLYVDLFDSSDSLIGKGILKIKVGDLMTQMRTMSAFGGESNKERKDAKLKFFQYFGQSLFKTYAGTIAPLHKFNDAIPRKRRDLRTGEPQIYGIRTEDDVELKLQRFKGGDKGPVLFLHGLGVSSKIFSTDTISTNLLEFVYAAGYDCWLLDNRVSSDLESAKEQWNADVIAQLDYPAAVKNILNVTSAEAVHVIAHCYGATTFTMAMMSGLQNIKSAVVSQISVDVFIPWWPQRLLSHLRMPSLMGFFGTKTVTARAQKKDRLFIRSLDRLIRIILPTQSEERSQSATSNRITMLYGSLYEHEQLNSLTYLEGLPEMFGDANITAFKQLARMGRCTYVVDAKGKDVYRPNIDKLNIPITFIHGAENACFSPKSTKRTYDRLVNDFGQESFRRHVIPNYGHIDCIFGKNAVDDVYPYILEHLRRNP